MLSLRALLFVHVLAFPGAAALLLRGGPGLKHDGGLASNLSVASINNTLPPFSVCAMGDSITDGLQGHDDVYLNRGGYRRILAEHLENAGAELTGYKTCPCPAYIWSRSAQLHEQLKKNHFMCGSALGARHPDIALLLIGANDMRLQITVEQTLFNVRELLQDLWMESPQTIVLIASVPVHPGSPATYNAYNAGLRQLAAELKAVAPIEYVPMAEDTGICAMGLCHADHMHPTAEGYTVMASEWWKFIEPWLLQRQASMR